MWSPQEVIRRIRATEKTAAAIPERYSDELLVLQPQESLALAARPDKLNPRL